MYNYIQLIIKYVHYIITYFFCHWIINIVIYFLYRRVPVRPLPKGCDQMEGGLAIPSSCFLSSPPVLFSLVSSWVRATSEDGCRCLSLSVASWVASSKPSLVPGVCACLKRQWSWELVEPWSRGLGAYGSYLQTHFSMTEQGRWLNVQLFFWEASISTAMLLFPPGTIPQSDMSTCAAHTYIHKSGPGITYLGNFLYIRMFTRNIRDQI